MRNNEVILHIIHMLCYRNHFITFTGQGIPPLLYASDRGFLKTLEILLEYGADINSTDNDGNTSVVYAAINDSEVRF